MGVVDDHGEIPAGGDDFRPALHPLHGAERFHHLVEGDPQPQRAGGGRQRVVHGEQAGNAQPHPADDPGANQLKFHAFRPLLNLPGRVIRRVALG